MDAEVTVAWWLPCSAITSVRHLKESQSHLFNRSLDFQWWLLITDQSSISIGLSVVKSYLSSRLSSSSSSYSPPSLPSFPPSHSLARQAVSSLSWAASHPQPRWPWSLSSRQIARQPNDNENEINVKTCKLLTFEISKKKLMVDTFSGVMTSARVNVWYPGMLSGFVKGNLLRDCAGICFLYFRLAACSLWGRCGLRWWRGACAGLLCKVVTWWPIRLTTAAFVQVLDIHYLR